MTRWWQVVQTMTNNYKPTTIAQCYNQQLQNNDKQHKAMMNNYKATTNNIKQQLTITRQWQEIARSLGEQLQKKNKGGNVQQNKNKTTKNTRK